MRVAPLFLSATLFCSTWKLRADGGEVIPFTLPSKACRVYVGYPDLPPAHPFDRGAFVDAIQQRVGPLQWVSPDCCILAFFSCVAAKQAQALFDGHAIGPGLAVRVVPSSKSTFPGPLPLPACLTLINYYAGIGSYSSDVSKVVTSPGEAPGTLVASATVTFRLTGSPDVMLEGSCISDEEALVDVHVATKCAVARARQRVFERLVMVVYGGGVAVPGGRTVFLVLPPMDSGHGGGAVRGRGVGGSSEDAVGDIARGMGFPQAASDADDPPPPCTLHGSSGMDPGGAWACTLCHAHVTAHLGESLQDAPVFEDVEPEVREAMLGQLRSDAGAAADPCRVSPPRSPDARAGGAGPGIVHGIVHGVVHGIVGEPRAGSGTMVDPVTGSC